MFVHVSAVNGAGPLHDGQKDSYDVGQDRRPENRGPKTSGEPKSTTRHRSRSRLTARGTPRICRNRLHPFVRPGAFFDNRCKPPSLARLVCRAWAERFRSRDLKLRSLPPGPSRGSMSRMATEIGSLQARTRWPAATCSQCFMAVADVDPSDHCGRDSYRAEGGKFGLLIFIPKPPSSSEMNSIPAASNTCAMPFNVPPHSCSPLSKRLIVCVDTCAASASCRTPHRNAIRASLHDRVPPSGVVRR